MKITTKILETKVENYNRISDVKLKLNNDCVDGINLYTETNNFICCGKSAQVAMVLDALLMVKHLENN